MKWYYGINNFHRNNNSYREFKCVVNIRFGITHIPNSVSFNISFEHNNPIKEEQFKRYIISLADNIKSIRTHYQHDVPQDDVDYLCGILMKAFLSVALNVGVGNQFKCVKLDEQF